MSHTKKPELRFVTHQQVNEENWNACIAASRERLVYGYNWYLSSVCRTWCAVVEEQDGEYVSVFPLPLGHRLGQEQIRQPYFTQQLGLFTTAASKYKDVADYVALIPAKYKSVYLQLNTQNNLTTSITGYETSARLTYHLNLQPAYPALVRGYSTNQKRNLKRAQQSGLCLDPLQSIAPLIQLFKGTKGKELAEMKPKHYKLLEQLHHELEKQGVAELLQARTAEGEMQAAALLVHQPDKIIFLFGASSASGRQTGAMALLLDSVIQRYAGTARALDFEGSMVPSVAKFYANFGASPISYVSLRHQHTPWYLAWKRKTYIS
ncbi:GNAT family N-acetyltransferase [Pontibacter oryzae]|nr:GNAT family N-acetyltransferase [Pontibacter oryzae]